MPDAGLKEQVREFWDAEPCGDMHSEAEPGTPEYFAAVERQRDEAEPYIADYADFSGARGETVLEIGTGLGTDHIRFARAGAITTGIDLTPQSIELVGRRFANEGLEGTLVQGDAENLPFADGMFDRVYSWGVLHHTPDTDRAVREAIRVVKPGGDICVMLYGRHSWVAWALWSKYALLKGRPWRSLNSILGEYMESPGTKGYTPRELRRMFAGLEDLRIEPVATVYDRNYAGPLVRLTGDRFGWFIVIRGRQPRVA
jgi:ubiquinone/menaquinone biosynthesis C-methylase UbiE